MTIRPPKAGRDPPPAGEADERRTAVTDDRGEGRQDLERQTPAGDDRDDDGDDPLQDVEQAGRGRRPGPERAEDIRAAGPAAADRAGIGAAGQAGDDDAPRDPADHVGDHDHGSSDRDLAGIHRSRV